MKLIFSSKKKESIYTTSSSNYVGCFPIVSLTGVGLVNGLTLSEVNSLVYSMRMSPASTSLGYYVYPSQMDIETCLNICLTYSYPFMGFGNK